MPDMHDDMDVVYGNTPAQRSAALTVVRECADEASLAELVAMLGLGDTRER